MTASIILLFRIKQINQKNSFSIAFKNVDL